MGLREIGKAFLYMGNFNQGISYLDTVIYLSSGLESSLKSMNRQSLADTYLALSQVQSVLGKYDESLKNAGHSLEIYSNLKNETGQSECRLLLGKVINEVSNPASPPLGSEVVLPYPIFNTCPESNSTPTATRLPEGGQ